jgi:DNA-binding transcriptional regulator YiaG
VETVNATEIVEKAKASKALPTPAMQKAIIVEGGVTEADVARVLGVHRVTVNRWVMGHRRPTGNRLVQYEQLLRELAGK